MKKKQVLVVGGYGSIGSTISLLLSENEELYPVVAGRHPSFHRPAVGLAHSPPGKHLQIHHNG